MPPGVLRHGSSKRRGDVLPFKGDYYYLLGTLLWLDERGKH
ncbi:MAG TPA: hypothetical protein VF735_11045 [Pyrinomonadaceae bacterium]|jgi:hypothetical protein